MCNFIIHCINFFENKFDVCKFFKKILTPAACPILFPLTSLCVCVCVTVKVLVCVCDKEIGHHTRERPQCCRYLPYKWFLLLACTGEKWHVYNNVFHGDWFFPDCHLADGHPGSIWQWIHSTGLRHHLCSQYHAQLHPGIVLVSVLFYQLPWSAPPSYSFALSTMISSTQIIALLLAPWSAPPGYRYDLVTMISTTSVSPSSPLMYHCQHHYYHFLCLGRMISLLHQVTPSFWLCLYTNSIFRFTHFVYHQCKIGSILHQFMQISKRQHDPW